jgi:hypothetical protein
MPVLNLPALLIQYCMHAYALLLAAVLLTSGLFA